MPDDTLQPDPAVHERLIATLRDAGVAIEVSQHAPVFTSAAAAAARGVALRTGAKALIIKAGSEFVMAVLPADLSLDSVALRKLLKAKKSRFATREEVFEMTRLTPGAIPPFGSFFKLPTICDERLAENESINFNAASHSASIRMTYADYIAYEQPQLARVAKNTP